MLRPFLLKYKKQFILGPLLKFIETVFELLVPLLMANIIDYGMKNHDFSYIIQRGALLLALAVLGYLFAATAQYLAADAQQEFGTDLRQAMFRKINSLSQKERDLYPPATLMTRIGSDVNQLQSAVAMAIRLLVRSPVIVVGAFLMSFLISPKLSLIFLCVIPLLSLVVWFLMSRSLPLFRKVREKADTINRLTKENLDGARVIRSFSREKETEEKFEQASHEATELSVKVGKLSAFMNPVTSVIVNFGILAILYFSQTEVHIGSLTQGETVALVNYMIQILGSLVVFANVIVLFAKASASKKRVEEVLALSLSVLDGDGAEPIKDDNTPAITFSNLSFSYTKSEEKVLKDISFSVNRGEKIGIIGGTGAGKSTLLSLLMRFYDAESGDILLFGNPIKDYMLEELRGIFAFVPQKATLLSGTIYSNLALGNKEANEDLLWKALGIAQGKDFVQALPDGLYAPVQRGGKNFSGGQRQRLTIARGLVKTSDIFILDDATSACDTLTDEKIRQGIGKLTDKTVLMVSQRVSAIKTASRILVLHEGKVAGFDTHEALLACCPIYQEICQSQNMAKEGVE